MWRMISAPHLCLTACEIARLQGLMDDMAGLWRDRRQHYPCAGKNLSTFDDLWCRGGFEVGFLHPLLTQILRGSIELEPGRVSALLVKLWVMLWPTGDWKSREKNLCHIGTACTLRSMAIVALLIDTSPQWVPHRSLSYHSSTTWSTKDPEINYSLTILIWVVATQIFVDFQPETWGNHPIWLFDEYFSKWGWNHQLVIQAVHPKPWDPPGFCRPTITSLPGAINSEDNEVDQDGA